MYIKKIDYILWLGNEGRREEPFVLKNIKLFLGILGIIWLASCSPSEFIEREPTSAVSPTWIQVAGTGEVYLTPDVVYITIGVSNQNETMKDGLVQNSFISQQLKDALVRQEINPADIQTVAFNISPVIDSGSQDGVARTNFLTENFLYVTIRKLDRLKDILDIILNSGANRIYGLAFDVQDKEKFIAESRKKAIENAIQSAQYQASAAGLQVGQVTSLNVSSNGIPQLTFSLPGTANASGINLPTTVGKLVISANATMMVEIK